MAQLSLDLFFISFIQPLALFIELRSFLEQGRMPEKAVEIAFDLICVEEQVLESTNAKMEHCDYISL